MHLATRSCETMLSYGTRASREASHPRLPAERPQALSPDVPTHEFARRLRSIVHCGRSRKGRGDEIGPRDVQRGKRCSPGKHSPGPIPVCPPHAGEGFLLFTLRSSRSRPPSDQDQVGPRRTWPPPRTRRQRSRRRSRCRHAPAPASCRRAGYRCRRAWPPGCGT